MSKLTVSPVEPKPPPSPYIQYTYHCASGKFTMDPETLRNLMQGAAECAIKKTKK